MTDTTALIEALERAEGPSRELDARIAVWGGWCLHPTERQRDDSVQSDTGYTCLDCGADSWGNTGPSGQKRSAPLPAFTASIDAALTLVPEEWAWTAARYWCEGESAPPYYADCADLPALMAGQDVPVFEAKASTPAIALVIAALRAKAGEA